MSMATSDQGVIWVGTYNSGISNFDNFPPHVETIKLLPFEIKIIGNYPNPFNSATNITFSLSDKNIVDIVIYNNIGQKIRSLLSENLTSGTHTVHWDGKNDFGRNVSTGIYFIGIKNAGPNKASHKMMLLR